MDDERFLIGIFLDSVQPVVLNKVKETFVVALEREEFCYDLMYFYQPDNLEMTNRLSKGIGALMNAKPKKVNFTSAIKETFNVVMNNHTDDFQRLVIVITDNYKKESEFSSYLFLMKQNDCSYVFFGLGENYDKSSLKNLGVVYHVDDIHALKNEIVKFTNELIEGRKMANMFEPTKNSKFFKMQSNMKPFANQLVDVIIPFYGQYKEVSDLMYSLLYKTYIVNFRVCLVDDCSPNVTFPETAFESAPNVKVVRNESRMGFGASLEIGMRALEREKRVFPWVIFMHSDVVIEDPNWMLALGQSMLELKNQGVKMVSAMTDNPTTNNSYLLAKKTEKRKDVILENGYLPLYCALCHRELFGRIGGFIKPYPYMGFEDRELAERMRHYKFKQAVCGKSWVHHEGGATLRYVNTHEPDVFNIIEQNKNLWKEDIKKWGEKRK